MQEALLSSLILEALLFAIVVDCKLLNRSLTDGRPAGRFVVLLDCALLSTGFVVFVVGVVWVR
jgi:hypothetical protein